MPIKQIHFLVVFCFSSPNTNTPKMNIKLNIRGFIIGSKYDTSLRVIKNTNKNDGMIVKNDDKIHLV